MNRFTQSAELFERASQVIPLGTQTMSKSPTQFVQGAVPIYLERGKGSHVWDIEGNEWVDYPMALGPVILGYADDDVNAAIRRQLDDGITFTLNHPLEVDVAERIVAMCPGVEAVRFGKTGSDVVSAAVRAARAITGRDIVLCAGYHGWHDWYIGSTTRNAGVPAATSALTKTFIYNDLDDLERVLAENVGQVAAVVIEPSGATIPNEGYLEGFVERVQAAGALSVFDEVITGFRLAPGGARERYGVEPDLSCYGKALGNGMPISAIGGRWETMRVFETIFFSGTHGGEALSLAAAGAVLDRLADGSVHRRIEELGQRMLGGVRELIASHGLDERVTATGEPHRTVVGFTGPEPLVDKSWVQQTLGAHRVLFNGSMFIAASHTTADIDQALDAFDAAFDGLRTALSVSDLLVGEPVQPVFRAP